MDATAETTFETREFRVMGTDARLLLRGDASRAAALLEGAERRLHELERRLTRFDASSELEQLNAAREADVSPILLELLEVSARFREHTGGRFDIGVGADVIAAGYDRTFAALTPVDDAARTQLHAHMLEHGTSATAAAAAAGTVQPPYVIDGNHVTLRAGVRLDLGGIGKGWAADRTARELTQESGSSALVSLGGDIAVEVVDGDEPWPVRASLGADGEVTLALAFGGMATSGWDGRMWTADDEGRIAHHVIDPLTGEPSITDIARITVIGPTCMDAEVWAKALMLVGSDAAAREAARLDLTAIMVRADGSCVTTGALA